MQINLDKARKLIDQLENALNETSAHTSSARDVIHKWLSNGEATMRAKSASALKQVRKRADRFTKALTDLERSLAKSLDKLSVKVAGKPANTAAKSASRPAPKTAAKKTAAKGRSAAKKAAKPAAKKTARKKPAVSKPSLVNPTVTATPQGKR